jgi:hypothetical protein
MATGDAIYRALRVTTFCKECIIPNSYYSNRTRQGVDAGGGGGVEGGAEEPHLQVSALWWSE